MPCLQKDGAYKSQWWTEVPSRYASQGNSLHHEISVQGLLVRIQSYYSWTSRSSWDHPPVFLESRAIWYHLRSCQDLITSAFSRTDRWVPAIPSWKGEAKGPTYGSQRTWGRITKLRKQSYVRILFLVCVGGRWGGGQWPTVLLIWRRLHRAHQICVFGQSMVNWVSKTVERDMAVWFISLLVIYLFF